MGTEFSVGFQKSKNNGSHWAIVGAVPPSQKTRGSARSFGLGYRIQTQRNRTVLGKGERVAKRKVKWGVLGAASIAVRKVIPGMQQGEYCDVAAIASRDLAKAKAAAAAENWQIVWVVRRVACRSRD